MGIDPEGTWDWSRFFFALAFIKGYNFSSWQHHFRSIGLDLTGSEVYERSRAIENAVKMLHKIIIDNVEFWFGALLKPLTKR